MFLLNPTAYNFILHKRNYLIAMFFLTMLSGTVQANLFIRAGSEFQEQRKEFQKVVEDGKLGKVSDERYREQLESYPLFPYIQYYYLVNHLDEPLESFEQFFKNHDDLASSSYLRKQLLSRLGEKQDWQNFIKFHKTADYFFSDSDLLSIRCYEIQARDAIKNKENEEPELDKDTVKELKNIYLSGSSLPKSCDPLFSRMEDEGKLDNELKMQRIELAIKEGNHALANFLSQSLSDDSKESFEQCRALKSSPKQLEAKEFNLDDNSFNRLCVTQGLMTLIESDPPLALVLWQELQKKFDFTKEEKTTFIEDATMRLFIKDSEHFASWIDLSSKTFSDPSLNEKVLVSYIRNRDWPAIISIYPRLSKEEQNDSMWQYWYSRSYIEYDQATYIHPNAYRILNKLSQKRDYYGFLASFHLNSMPVLSHQSFPIQEADLEKIANNINIIRAHEFYMLGDRTNASREWYYATKNLDEKQKGDAAILASQWGWIDQSIFTAANSSQFDNIELRFPLAYAENVNFNASKFGIPNEWVFATIRQESAYGVEAESSVGALGLMQIMPYTGKVLARENNLKRFSDDDLLDPNINIELGTYYLASLRKQYQGNMLLASAAYNAGPSNVNNWIRKNPDLDIEMWIETIPFKETRNYVKNILTYQIIYQHRLGRMTNSERLFLPVK